MNIFPLGGVQGVQHPTVPNVRYGVLCCVVVKNSRFNAALHIGLTCNNIFDSTVVGKASLLSTTTTLPMMWFASELTHFTKKKQIVVFGKHFLTMMVFMRYVILGKVRTSQEVTHRHHAKDVK